MKIVALYYRVSSDDQKKRETIENQVEILHTYIEMKGDLEIYGEYPDDGISGTIPLGNRPYGARLMQDASKKLFDTVIVWKVDRFGRDTLTGLQAAETIINCGVEILSVTEPFDLNTPTGRFQFINYLNMAELERNNILDRMYIGATRAAKKGKWLGGIIPYGYNVNKDGYLEINENEAAVVRKIYDLYAYGGLSSIKIAVYLNNLNIPSSCGTGKGKRKKGITNKWRSSSIQRIINSTTYKGIHYYGKRASRRKELIKREVPAIVDCELWDKTQIAKANNCIISKRNNNKRQYLLRGLIKCKYCGHTFYGISYKKSSDVYVCSGKRGENASVLGLKCNNLNINADEIENSVWNDCKNILSNYDKYINELKDKGTNNDDNTLDDIAKLQQSLTKKENEKNNILTLFRKDVITEEEVEYQIKDIRAEEDKIANLVLALEQRTNSHQHEDTLIKNMSDKLKYYHDRIDNLTFEEKQDIVKLLVKSIIAETVIVNGEKTSQFNIIYNLVKLDDRMDMDSDSKFDIHRNKAMIHHQIGDETPGSLLRNLRLKSNMTIKQLSKATGIDTTTLMHVEQGKVKMPYFYWKTICNYYGINHIKYLKLYTMNENTIEEKFLKLRACIGAKTWGEVSSRLGYNKAFVSDLLHRYKANSKHLDKINSLLKEFN